MERFFSKKSGSPSSAGQPALSASDPSVKQSGSSSSVNWKIASALGDFQALEYGAEYVPLRKGTQVNVAVDVAEDQGYVYGRNEIGEEGWFPATHVELMSESPVDQHAVDAKGASHPVCHSGVALVLDSNGYCGHAKRFANLAFQI